MWGIVKQVMKGSTMRMIGLSFIICHLSFSVCACSESEDEATDEYANWQVRNEAYFATLEDSLSRGGSAWQKFKSYSKDQQAAGVNTDYIYVKVLERGSKTDSPLYTDTVRVSYRGRQIPSVSYPEGKVFDQTYYGTFNWQTAAVSKGVVSSYVDGFTTALLHMHPGDRWRVYIPYQLGYGENPRSTSSSSESIPAYSTLIFDLALVEYWQPGEKRPVWSSRAEGNRALNDK